MALTTGPGRGRGALVAPLLLAALGCAGAFEFDPTPGDDLAHGTAAEAQARGYRVPDGARDVSARTRRLPDATRVWVRFTLEAADLDLLLGEAGAGARGTWPDDAPVDWPDFGAIDADRFATPGWWAPPPGSPMVHRTTRATPAPGGSQGSGDLWVVAGSTVFRTAFRMDGWAGAGADP